MAFGDKIKANAESISGFRSSESPSHGMPGDQAFEQNAFQTFHQKVTQFYLAAQTEVEQSL